MLFNVMLVTLACLLVASPLIFFKLLNLRDLFVDWVERKQFERLIDQAEERGR